MFEGGMSVRDDRAALRSDTVGGETISGKGTGRLIGSEERRWREVIGRGGGGEEKVKRFSFRMALGLGTKGEKDDEDLNSIKIYLLNMILLRG